MATLTRSPVETHPGSSPTVHRWALPVEFRGPAGKPLALTWLVSRAATLVVLGLAGGPVTGDVFYYARSLQTIVQDRSVHVTLQEYPVPVLGIMLPQYVLGAFNTVAFAFLFAGSMLAVDATFTWFLWRMTGRRRSPAVTFWLLFVPAMGPLAYFRFDLVPAVLAGAALLAVVRRPRWTGVLTGLGVVLKLWPVVMLPMYLLRRSGRRPVVTWFALTCVSIGAVSLLIGGLRRLVSPLHWQAARGLQIESVPAVPLMLARSVHPHGVWDIRTSRYKATEIFGPGVDAMIIVSTVATVAGLVVLGWLWLRAWRLGSAVPLATLGWLILAAAAVVTVTNKTLSPQYVLWLGGPLAALLVFAPDDPDVRRAARLLLVLSVLTQVIYPIGYSRLVIVGWQTAPMTVLLAARDALLVWLAWMACAQVWRRTAMPTGPTGRATAAAGMAAVGTPNGTAR
jgi:hypothetical protein